MQLWQPNQPLQDGKYIIEKTIGSGGFGITYKAKEQRSGQLVAIKTLSHLEQAKPDFRQRQQKFVNEALRLARCSHPHIVPVYELIDEDGLWGMVMEYIEGEDLATYIENRGVLSEAEALRLIRQIGEALTLVHNQGFLHRDIKPNNIILRRDTQTAVLIDFGLAREVNLGQLQSMTNHRTECFAPIEQYDRQGKFGAYTDVYALAATLYVLLTGQVPFPAQIRAQNIPLTEPKQHNSQISDKVNAAIIKGMELLPENRPQSVRSWLDLLVQSGLKVFRFEVVSLNAKGEIINRQQRQAEYYVETFHGTSLEMVAIPGGTFMMGSPETEEGRYDSESPQHRVTVAPFFMGKYPITQEQYEAVMGNNPSDFKGKKRPVEQVSWDDANEFCQKLSQKTGKKYRLPSEAEWEYACRAGTTTPFHFGETITTDVANYDGNYTYASAPKGVYRQKTTDVGSFPANNFGLYDLHGNVWEWCADIWHENYNGAPSDGSIWESGGDNTQRLLRGGSWCILPRNCRSADRYGDNPDSRDDIIGFRLVLSA
jgi:formylglycine-generating enzyme required for sulfatase activity/predicted Ser/Thr protein kinase